MIRTFFRIALVVSLAGCAATRGSGRSEPATENFTPFFYTFGLSQAPDGAFFHTGTLKTTLVPAQDGSLKYSSEQSPVTQAPRVDSSCPGTLAAVNEVAAFKRRAELYVLGPVRSEAAELKFGAAVRKLKANGRCYEAAPDAPLALLEEVSGSESVTFRSPKGKVSEIWPGRAPFVPFLLVRYENGAVVPAPLRVDTVVINPARRTLDLIWRTTIAGNEPIRKVEFRVEEPHTLELDPAPGEDLHWRGARKAILRFLAACPRPDAPGEPCATPANAMNRVLFP